MPFTSGVPTPNSTGVVKTGPVLTIREFVSADVHAVMSIEQTAHPAGHWKAEDYDWLTAQPEGLVLVAEWAGVIAGFVAARRLGPDAEMLNLAVAEDCRRSGIGRSLVEELHRRLRADGTGRVYLEVRPSNIPAQQLYRSMGYVECGRRRNYYASNGEDALVLEIRLPNRERPPALERGRAPEL